MQTTKWKKKMLSLLKWGSGSVVTKIQISHFRDFESKYSLLISNKTHEIQWTLTHWIQNAFSQNDFKIDSLAVLD